MMPRWPKWTVAPARGARYPDFRKQMGFTFVNTLWRGVYESLQLLSCLGCEGASVFMIT